MEHEHKPVLFMLVWIKQKDRIKLKHISLRSASRPTVGLSSLSSNCIALCIRQWGTDVWTTTEAQSYSGSGLGPNRWEGWLVVSVSSAAIPHCWWRGVHARPWGISAMAKRVMNPRYLARYCRGHLYLASCIPKNNPIKIQIIKKG